MASLSLTPEVHVFPCPVCAQTINTSMQACSFCAAPIDSAAASLSAESFAKLNRAISDASYLKIMAGTALSFFLIRFIPFMGLIGVVGFLFLEIAIPVMTIRWWVKYNSIQSPEPEFRRARSTALFIGIGAVVFFALIGLGELVL